MYSTSVSEWLITDFHNHTEHCTFKWSFRGQASTKSIISDKFFFSAVNWHSIYCVITGMATHKHKEATAV